MILNMVSLDSPTRIQRFPILRVVLTRNKDLPEVVPSVHRYHRSIVTRSGSIPTVPYSQANGKHGRADECLQNQILKQADSFIKLAHTDERLQNQIVSTIIGEEESIMSNYQGIDGWVDPTRVEDTLGTFYGKGHVFSIKIFGQNSWSDFREAHNSSRKGTPLCV